MSKSKKNSKIGFFIGSIVLTAGAMIVIPKVIDAVSSRLYSSMSTNASNVDEDDNWGPEIVRKGKMKEE